MQVGETVTQMDAGHAAECGFGRRDGGSGASLNTQAGELVNAVAVFKLAQDSAYSAGTRFGATTAGPAASAPSSRPCWVPPKPPVRCARQRRRPQASRQPGCTGWEGPRPPRSSTAASGKGGADDEWESF